MARHAHGTPTTQAQHAARTPASSCPASPSCQPRERPLSLPQGTASLRQLHLEISSSSTGKPSPSVPQPPGRLTSLQGKPRESLGSQEICFQFPFTMAAQSQSCCRVVAAAPPWKDPSSTQVRGHPSPLSPDPCSKELIPIPELCFSAIPLVSYRPQSSRSSSLVPPQVLSLPIVAENPPSHKDPAPP